MVGEKPKTINVSGHVKFAHVCREEDLASITEVGLLLNKSSKNPSLIEGIYAWDLSHREALIKIGVTGKNIKKACICFGEYDGEYVKVLDGDHPLKGCIIFTGECIHIRDSVTFDAWIRDNRQRIEDIKFKLLMENINIQEGKR